MPDSLETVANRIAQLALREVPKLGRVGPGPVLSVVRDTETNEIFVGLNTGAPANLTDALQNSIRAQKERVAKGEVRVVHSDAKAQDGGHAEVCALNAAIRARQRRLKRALGEKDFRVFELHNIWLSGDSAGSAAARCEHCARITRGVTVTQSVFVAEGGVVGQTAVPQRGLIKRAGAANPEPVTTVEGTIEPRRTGGQAPKTSAVGEVAVSMLNAGFIIAEHALARYFAKKFQTKFEQDAQRVVISALNDNLALFNVWILARKADILWAKADERPVRLHVCVEALYTPTQFGLAITSAEVVHYDILYDGQPAVTWPNRTTPAWFTLAGGPDLDYRWECFDFPL